MDSLNKINTERDEALTQFENEILVNNKAIRNVKLKHLTISLSRRNELWKL